MVDISYYDEIIVIKTNSNQTYIKSLLNIYVVA